MLTPRHLLAMLAALLAGCDEDPAQTFQPLTAMQAEATYRLQFNDALVGNALFRLDIGNDGQYVLEAFTVPAGQMQQADAHEVLETSHGHMDAQGAQPSRFEYSVMRNDAVETVNLTFDWPERRLRMLGKDGRKDVALLPGTHDRLSYLLVARDLAAGARPEQQIQVASTEATEENLLQTLGSLPVDTPAGSFEAIGIRRVTPDADQRRVLWFDTGYSPLPVRIEHQWENNHVVMELENLQITPVAAGTNTR